jgi:hypothetical protein
VELDMLVVMGDLVVVEEEEMVAVQEDLEVLEIHHQHHHHKEILEDLAEHLRLQHQEVAAVEVLVVLVVQHLHPALMGELVDLDPPVFMLLDQQIQ